MDIHQIQRNEQHVPLAPRARLRPAAMLRELGEGSVQGYRRRSVESATRTTDAKGAANVRAFVRRDGEDDVGRDGVVPATGSPRHSHRGSPRGQVCTGIVWALARRLPVRRL